LLLTKRPVQFSGPRFSNLTTDTSLYSANRRFNFIYLSIVFYPFLILLAARADDLN
jgi:hypothetical protein